MIEIKLKCHKTLFIKRFFRQITIAFFIMLFFLFNCSCRENNFSNSKHSSLSRGNGEVLSLVFFEDSYDFGSVVLSSPNEKLLKNFVFKNTSNFPVVIGSVTSECSCVVNVWPDYPIDSQEVDTIKVTYAVYGNMPHFFSKSVSVRYSGNNEPKQLKIRGQISEIK